MSQLHQDIERRFGQDVPLAVLDLDDENITRISWRASGGASESEILARFFMLDHSLRAVQNSESERLDSLLKLLVCFPDEDHAAACAEVGRRVKCLAAIREALAAWIGKKLNLKVVPT